MAITHKIQSDILEADTYPLSNNNSKYFACQEKYDYLL